MKSTASAYGSLVLGAFVSLMLACAHPPQPSPSGQPVTAVTNTRGKQLRVMISGGFTAAYQRLLPQFERTTGFKVETAYGPSMGDAPDAIPLRLQRGEPADVVIVVKSALAALSERGMVRSDGQVELARSRIGVAVRANAPKPDVGTVEALAYTLLRAKSIAYSDSASGVYVSNDLFARLGIADQVRTKSRQIKSERVGNVIARGEAEIGFQQISELLPVPGIAFLGPIPSEVQKITVYSAGIAASAREPSGAAALIQFLSSTQARPAIPDTGLDPIAARD